MKKFIKWLEVYCLRGFIDILQFVEGTSRNLAISAGKNLFLGRALHGFLEMAWICKFREDNVLCRLSLHLRR